MRIIKFGGRITVFGGSKMGGIGHDPPTEAKSRLFHVRGNAVCRLQLSPNHLVARALPRTLLGQLTVLPRSRLVERAYRPPTKIPTPLGLGLWFPKHSLDPPLITVSPHSTEVPKM